LGCAKEPHEGRGLGVEEGIKRGTVDGEPAPVEIVGFVYMYGKKGEVRQAGEEE